MNEIKQARLAAGLTQEQMSAMLHTPTRTICSWESGSRKPSEYVKSLVVEKLKSLKAAE